MESFLRTPGPHDQAAQRWPGSPASLMGGRWGCWHFTGVCSQWGCALHVDGQESLGPRLGGRIMPRAVPMSSATWGPGIGQLHGKGELRLLTADLKLSGGAHSIPRVLEWGGGRPDSQDPGHGVMRKTNWLFPAWKVDGDHEHRNGGSFQRREGKERILSWSPQKEQPVALDPQATALGEEVCAPLSEWHVLHKAQRNVPRASGAR